MKKSNKCAKGMKEQINPEVVYITKCRMCGETYRYMLTGEFCNPGIDYKRVMCHYKQEAHRFLYCEKCELETKQEIVAFDIKENDNDQS